MTKTVCKPKVKFALDIVEEFPVEEPKWGTKWVEVKQTMLL